MESLSLSVNGVSYTVAAELAPTSDPFTGPIKNIAQWNFTILAVLMFVVTSLSLCENFLVMFITFKFKQLRQPLNYIIVNLAIADFLVSLTGGLISFLTNARGYFFLGRWACVLEGFAVTYFGESPHVGTLWPRRQLPFLTVGVSVGAFCGSSALKPPFLQPKQMTNLLTTNKFGHPETVLTRRLKAPLKLNKREA